MADALPPGVILHKDYLPQDTQKTLMDLILKGADEMSWISPVTPGGKPFSVRQVNFGSLGWISDRKGYRYSPTHPHTGQTWLPIPEPILAIWADLLPTAPSPECCLVNHYLDAAKMGMHQDRDEDDQTTPILSISLGQSAKFRIGKTDRPTPTQSFPLNSGDVLIMGGASRLAYHGIDRLIEADPLFTPHTAILEGRLNITLRRVTKSVLSPNEGD